jgi:hypothetical protein
LRGRKTPDLKSADYIPKLSLIFPIRNSFSKIIDLQTLDEMIASKTLFLLVEYIMTSLAGILRNVTGHDRSISQECVLRFLAILACVNHYTRHLAAWHYTPNLGFHPQFIVCNALLPGHISTKSPTKDCHRLHRTFQGHKCHSKTVEQKLLTMCR